MQSYILASTSQIRALVQNTGEVIFTSQTLTDATNKVSVTGEDIRGGAGNKLLGRYFHDSDLKVTITDALFSLERIATVVGTSVTIGGEAVTRETITTTTANTITVSQTPVTWQNVGTIGWYSTDGGNTSNLITFTGKTATVSGLASGTTVCVTYIAENDAMKTFIVPATIIPSEVTLEITSNVFKADSGTGYSQASKVGNLIITIPRFQFDGSIDLSLTSKGASNTALNGSALAYNSGAGCDSVGQYAKIDLVIDNAAWDDTLTALAVVGSNITLAKNATTTLQVQGLYQGGITGIVNNANLTFTSGTTSVATVSNAGVVTAVATGTSIITIVDTTNNAIVTYAQVTVS